MMPPESLQLSRYLRRLQTRTILCDYRVRYELNGALRPLPEEAMQ